MTKTKEYWFKRRRYGYGWTPSTWQGWLVVIIALIIILGATFLFATTSPNSQSVLLYLNTVFMSIILAFIVSHNKAPSPKWRWGKKEHDNTDEDF